LDGYITIGAATPNTWTQLCGALGAPELAEDERFADNPRRMQNVAALIAIIEGVTTTRTSAEWQANLDAAGVPCGALNTIAEAMADPHLQAREFIVEIDHPRAGSTRATGFPVRLSATPARLRRPAPVLGEHTAEVLTELGLDAADIDELRRASAI
jgi:crotonobetainyl-CoA:carnitine CoA-transferase CaiB-like acyl-CoA transferase